MILVLMFYDHDAIRVDTDLRQRGDRLFEVAPFGVVGTHGQDIDIGILRQRESVGVTKHMAGTHNHDIKPFGEFVDDLGSAFTLQLSADLIICEVAARQEVVDAVFRLGISPYKR